QGVGHADMQVAATSAHLDNERRDHGELISAGDAGELGVHLRSNIFELYGVDTFPGFSVAFQRHAEQSTDDALFCSGEVPAFHSCAVAAMTTEQTVNDQKDQAWVVGKQRCTAQRLHGNHGQVAGNGQIALEVGILLYTQEADSNVGVTAHEVQKYAAQSPCKALVDEFE